MAFAEIEVDQKYHRHIIGKNGANGESMPTSWIRVQPVLRPSSVFTPFKNPLCFYFKAFSLFIYGSGVVVGGLWGSLTYFEPGIQGRAWGASSICPVTILFFFLIEKISTDFSIEYINNISSILWSCYDWEGEAHHFFTIDKRWGLEFHAFEGAQNVCTHIFRIPPAPHPHK